MLMLPCVLGEFRTIDRGDEKAKQIIGLPETRSSRKEAGRRHAEAMGRLSFGPISTQNMGFTWFCRWF